MKQENRHFLVRLLCAMFFMQHAFKKISLNTVKSLCAGWPLRLHKKIDINPLICMMWQSTRSNGNLV
jgi:hypothetical protein